MGVGKKILISVLSIICVICLALDIWCVCVYKWGEEKIVSNTMNVGEMQNVDGTDKKTFMEINYYSNKNGNGVELFEIKYNQFSDEEMKQFVSVGSQFVSTSETTNIKFVDLSTSMAFHESYKEEKYGLFNLGTRKYHKTFIGKGIDLNTTNYFEYQSSDDYEFSLGNAINVLNGDSAFKITIDDELYLVKFRKDCDFDEFNLGTLKIKTTISESIYEYYSYVDHNLIASALYDSFKTSTSLSNGYTTIRLGDYFEYWGFNGKTYEKLDETNNSKVQTEFINNYVIKVNVSHDGATKSNQSLFNQINGDSEFDLTGDYITSDYLYGKSVIELDYKAFEFLYVNGDSYALRLKDSVAEELDSYKKDIVLDVNIDLDYLESKGYEFFGFTEKAFGDFTVYECTTSRIVDGEIVYSEVILDA